MVSVKHLPEFAKMQAQANVVKEQMRTNRYLFQDQKLSTAKIEAGKIKRDKYAKYL